jgi:wyosine [tRNA(Phe)-imidazoG37] synthetase (radical SAM superfamily)
MRGLDRPGEERMSAKHVLMARPATAVCEREAFEHPFTPLGGRYVYAVVSPRARGLSLGINLNPTKYCNFDCVYCEVDRRGTAPVNSAVDVDQIAVELEQALKRIHRGWLSTHPGFRNVSPDLLQLKHVTLSGEGEPTLCPNFHEVVETVIHLRASARVPFFKLVLVTNASGLDRPEVAYGVSLLARRDEIWAKLDGGTQAYLDRINRAETPLLRIMENIKSLAQQRPVVIQTMVPAIDGRNPFEGELHEYIARLNELKAAGGQIALVQIYSASRPGPRSECGHLPLMALSEMAKQVRAGTGLRTEVF